MSPELRVGRYVWTWAALLLLLALTCGSAYLHLGPFNLALNLLIACAKALLVLLVFMDLRRSNPLSRIVAAAGFFWLALLALLSAADFLTQH